MTQTRSSSQKIQRVALYMRVSTTEQVNEWYGLDSQNRILRAYVESNEDQGWATSDNLAYTDKLNEEWVVSGESITNVKCASCHKMTDEKLVGPGWKDVTKRRTGSWIMNFITNPDPMIDKDPEAQAMLELCLVRMPNQSLSDAEARNIFEYMRRNDGVK